MQARTTSTTESIEDPLDLMYRLTILFRRIPRLLRELSMHRTPPPSRPTLLNQFLQIIERLRTMHLVPKESQDHVLEDPVIWIKTPDHHVTRQFTGILTFSPGFVAHV